MSVTYVGNYQWQEIRHPSYSQDEFNRNIVTRTFGGHPDLVAAWLKEYKDGKKDADFPTLELTAQPEVSPINSSYLQAIAQFKGAMPGNKLEAQFSSALVLEEVTITRENTNTAPLTIEYHAPQTTIRYATRTEPRKAKYKGFMLPMDDAFRINRMRGTKGNLVRRDTLPTFHVNGKDYLRIPGDGDYPYELDVVPTDFQKAQDGRWWLVTEVNQGRIIEHETAKRARLHLYSVG